MAKFLLLLATAGYAQAGGVSCSNAPTQKGTDIIRTDKTIRSFFDPSLCIVADSDLAAKDVHGHKDAKLYWANCTGQVIDTAFTIKHKSSKTKNTTDVGVVMAKFSYEAAKKNNVDRGSGFIKLLNHKDRCMKLTEPSGLEAKRGSKAVMARCRKEGWKSAKFRFFVKFSSLFYERGKKDNFKTKYCLVTGKSGETVKFRQCFRTLMGPASS